MKISEMNKEELYNYMRASREWNRYDSTMLLYQVAKSIGQCMAGSYQRAKRKPLSRYPQRAISINDASPIVRHAMRLLRWGYQF
jgi:hypothetical protein